MSSVSGTVGTRRLEGQRRRWVGYVLRYGLLLLAGAIVVLPIYMAVVNALLPRESVISYPPKLFPLHPDWDNFRDAWSTVPMGRYLLNSLIMSGVIVVGQLLTASVSAYAFSFLRFPFRTPLFVLFLATLMVPWEVAIVPNYQTVVWMGGKLGGNILSLDSYQALTIPFMATGFGTFLLRQHFMTIPQELRDAAAIDGYGHLRFLLFVVIPLSRPILAALAVFAFLQSWNQYLWPLLVTNEDSMRTVQIGLRALSSQEVDSLNVVMAGTVIAALPMLILLIIFQRQLVRGLTAGALKG